MRQSTRNLAIFCALLYLGVVAIFFFLIRRGNGGHFIYALDDPYIHLAMAENLAHGHYGINLSEMSSPSSSILWPFLLVPFSGTAFHPYVPLLWNMVFGTVSAALIGFAVARWPPQADAQGRMPWWQQAITAVLLMLTANLVSLTMVGMEHVLQVMLSICCAVGMMEALSGRPIPRWSLAAAAVAPMVRYEDLTLTVAVCLALIGMNQWKKGVVLLGAAVAPLLAFTAFLKSQHLPGLPMSVLVKAGNAYVPGGALYRAFKTIRSGVYQELTGPESYPVIVLFLLCVGLAWNAKNRTHRYVFAGAAVLGALQLTVGRFGWFYRYEVYALIFLLMLCLRALAERPRFLFGYFALGLVFCAAPFITATRLTVSASSEIYDQQYQMHRFVSEFYTGDYAVNDLGLASFQRRPGTYVLDVYGLASVEASRQTNKTAAWLQQIVQRHQIGLAILYPDWFSIPASWTPVAKMCLPKSTLNIGEQCTVFYSTTAASEPIIRSDLTRFAPTLPTSVIFYFDPERNEGGIAMPRRPAD